VRKLVVVALLGLVAQLVDGSLGMGYGATSSTLLVLVGLTPLAASASVHFSELGTNLASGLAHWRLRNVDWPVVTGIAGPGRDWRVRWGNGVVDRMGQAIDVGDLDAAGQLHHRSLRHRHPAAAEETVHHTSLAPLGLFAGLR
jgi:Sulfite exporter TauE/SafE